MKTKDPKFSEFKRDLEIYKKYRMWRYLLLLLLLLGLGRSMDYESASLYILSILVLVCSYDTYKDLYVYHLQRKLQKKIKKEKGYLELIKKEYPTILSCDHDNLRPDLKKAAEYFFFTSCKPEKIIALREKEIENLEVQLKAYYFSPEKNFWQYFISWKWMKKIN